MLPFRRVVTSCALLLASVLPMVSTVGATDLYVVHRQSGTDTPPMLSAWRMNAKTGALTQVPGSPYPLPGMNRAHEVVVDPSNRYVYVATRWGGVAFGTSVVLGYVYAFARDTETGALSALPGSPFRHPMGGDFRSPVVAASGRVLYVSDPLSDTIDVFARDAGSGALQTGSGRAFVEAASNVDGIVLSPSGTALYATTSAGQLFAYAVDSFGGLTQTATVSSAVWRNTVVPVIDPSGRFLFAPNAETNDISGFAVSPSTGGLTEIPGSPFAAGVGVVTLAFAPSGAFLYALNGVEATVSAYRLEAGGWLSPVGPALPTDAPTDAPNSLVIDPQGRFAYVSNYAAGTISSYALDSSTGEMTALPSIATPARPSALAMTHATLRKSAF